MTTWRLCVFLLCVSGALVAPVNAQSPPAGDPLRDVAAANPVRTKLAYFAPAQFGDLPGWNDDNFRESSAAFRETCNALGRRPAWSGACGRFATIDARSGDAFRRFLEAEFVLYQIHNRDETPTGVVTGYYEPLLEGSRQRGGAFVFPIYGMPSDLLYLDSREAMGPGAATQFVVRGRTVIRADAVSVAPSERVYALQLSDSVPDVRDRKLRVRIDNGRIVAYPSRAQIDTQGLAQAEVLAWVADSTALYSMHIQGAGRIRMPDGEIVRLAFAEQNGHPFKPPVAANRIRTRGIGAALDPGLMTRGIDLQAQLDEEPVATPTASEGMRTRGLDVARATPAAAAKPRDSSAEVDRMVELLLGGGSEPPAKAPRPPAPAEVAKAPPVVKAAPEPRPAPVVTPSVATAPPPPAAKSASEPRPTVATAPIVAPSPPPVASTPSVATTLPPPVVAAVPIAPPRMAFGDDPSFIFFRLAAAREGGPIGALGVPLTPQRSIAVDPRSTPLGMPVYIAAEGASGAPMRRLMLAQDTGGAIRGAVRADYFWGFGAQAGQQASQTKTLARMWLLVPRDLALAGTMSTRGLGKRGVVDVETECLVADPELCVE